MPKKKTNDWTKPLSNAAKAEILAATFHLLTDHMPKVWSKVPKWLQSQIRQSMFDCSTDYRDFSKEDLKDCVEYCQWLNEKYPQPGSTLDVLLKKRKKKAKAARERRASKPDNSPEMRDFLYNKESSGR
jgi:hypothetical protein